MHTALVMSNSTLLIPFMMQVDDLTILHRIVFIYLSRGCEWNEVRNWRIHKNIGSDQDIERMN